FGYTGRDWDEDVDLQHNRARWYDPAVGRWVSEDPIGFKAGDVNLYRNVTHAVTTRTDPSGLQDPYQENREFFERILRERSSGRRSEPPPSSVFDDYLKQGARYTYNAPTANGTMSL